jgi:hypothetical protein
MDDPEIFGLYEEGLINWSGAFIGAADFLAALRAIKKRSRFDFPIAVVPLVRRRLVVAPDEFRHLKALKTLYRTLSLPLTSINSAPIATAPRIWIAAPTEGCFTSEGSTLAIAALYKRIR